MAWRLSFFVHCAKVKSISISNRENSREDVPLNFLSQLQKWRCHAYIWYLSTTLHNGMVSFLEKHSCFHAYLCYYLDTYTVNSRAETHVTIQEINFDGGLQTETC